MLPAISSATPQTSGAASVAAPASATTPFSATNAAQNDATTHPAHPIIIVPRAVSLASPTLLSPSSSSSLLLARSNSRGSLGTAAMASPTHQLQRSNSISPMPDKLLTTASSRLSLRHSHSEVMPSSSYHPPPSLTLSHSSSYYNIAPPVHMTDEDRVRAQHQSKLIHHQQLQAIVGSVDGAVAGGPGKRGSISTVFPPPSPSHQYPLSPLESPSASLRRQDIQALDDLSALLSMTPSSKSVLFQNQQVKRMTMDVDALPQIELSLFKRNSSTTSNSHTVRNSLDASSTTPGKRLSGSSSSSSASALMNSFEKEERRRSRRETLQQALNNNSSTNGENGIISSTRSRSRSPVLSSRSATTVNIAHPASTTASAGVSSASVSPEQYTNGDNNNNNNNNTNDSPSSSTSSSPRNATTSSGGGSGGTQNDPDGDTSSGDSSCDSPSELLRKSQKHSRYVKRIEERDARLKEIWRKADRKKERDRRRRSRAAGFGQREEDDDDDAGEEDDQEIEKQEQSENIVKEVDATSPASSVSPSPKRTSLTNSDRGGGDRGEEWLAAVSLRRSLLNPSSSSNHSGTNSPHTELDNEREEKEIAESIKIAKRIAREEQLRDEAEEKAREEMTRVEEEKEHTLMQQLQKALEMQQTPKAGSVMTTADGESTKGKKRSGVTRSRRRGASKSPSRRNRNTPPDTSDITTTTAVATATAAAASSTAATSSNPTHGTSSVGTTPSAASSKRTISNRRGTAFKFTSSLVHGDDKPVAAAKGNSTTASPAMNKRSSLVPNPTALTRSDSSSSTSSSTNQVAATSSVAAMPSTPSARRLKSRRQTGPLRKDIYEALLVKDAAVAGGGTTEKDLLNTTVVLKPNVMVVKDNSVKKPSSRTPSRPTSRTPSRTASPSTTAAVAAAATKFKSPSSSKPSSRAVSRVASPAMGDDEAVIEVKQSQHQQQQQHPLVPMLQFEKPAHHSIPIAQSSEATTQSSKSIQSKPLKSILRPSSTSLSSRVSTTNSASSTHRRHASLPSPPRSLVRFTSKHDELDDEGLPKIVVQVFQEKERSVREGEGVEEESEEEEEEEEQYNFSSSRYSDDDEDEEERHSPPLQPPPDSPLPSPDSFIVNYSLPDPLPSPDPDDSPRFGPELPSSSEFLGVTSHFHANSVSILPALGLTEEEVNQGAVVGRKEKGPFKLSDDDTQVQFNETQQAAFYREQIVSAREHNRDVQHNHDDPYQHHHHKHAYLKQDELGLGMRSDDEGSSFDPNQTVIISEKNSARRSRHEVEEEEEENNDTTANPEDDDGWKDGDDEDEEQIEGQQQQHDATDNDDTQEEEEEQLEVDYRPSKFSRTSNQPQSTNNNTTITTASFSRSYSVQPELGMVLTSKKLDNKHGQGKKPHATVLDEDAAADEESSSSFDNLNEDHAFHLAQQHLQRVPSTGFIGNKLTRFVSSTIAVPTKSSSARPTSQPIPNTQQTTQPAASSSAILSSSSVTTTPTQSNGRVRTLSNSRSQPTIMSKSKEIRDSTTGQHTALRGRSPSRVGTTAMDVTMHQPPPNGRTAGVSPLRRAISPSRTHTLHQPYAASSSPSTTSQHAGSLDSLPRTLPHKSLVQLERVARMHDVQVHDMDAVRKQLEFMEKKKKANVITKKSSSSAVGKPKAVSKSIHGIPSMPSLATSNSSPLLMTAAAANTNSSNSLLHVESARRKVSSAPTTQAFPHHHHHHHHHQQQQSQSHPSHPTHSSQLSFDRVTRELPLPKQFLEQPRAKRSHKIGMSAGEEEDEMKEIGATAVGMKSNSNTNNSGGEYAAPFLPRNLLGSVSSSPMSMSPQMNGSKSMPSLLHSPSKQLRSLPPSTSASSSTSMNGINVESAMSRGWIESTLAQHNRHAPPIVIRDDHIGYHNTNTASSSTRTSSSISKSVEKLLSTHQRKSSSPLSTVQTKNASTSPYAQQLVFKRTPSTSSLLQRRK